MQNLDCINRLINCFTKLPGVGYKTAERYAYKIVEEDETFSRDFCDAIKSVKSNVKFCKRCGNFATDEECGICKTRGGGAGFSQANTLQPRRGEAVCGENPAEAPVVVCVVRDPRDVIAIEKSGAFNGTYHVLHGVISPLDKKGPDDINLKSLLVRIRNEKITELIIATNPDVEGEATANYIAALVKPSGVKVTRIAQGLAIGTNLEYADQVTLSRALTNRTEI